MVAFRTAGMGTGTMGPAVRARSGSSGAATTTIGTARATTGGASVTLRRSVLTRGRASPQQRHHLRHLSEKSSLASSENTITELKRSAGSIGRKGDSWRCVRRKRIEKALSNKVSHSGNSIGLMSRLLVKDVTSSRERAEIALGVTKVSEHVSPGAFSRRTLIPKTEILLENGLACKNDVRHIHHLLRSHGRESMLGKINEIVDSVEDSANREKDVIEHVEGGHFLCLDLLRRNFPMSGEKMHQNSANIGGVLASSAVEQGP